MLLRAVAGTVRMQLQNTRHDVEDLMPVFTMPLFTLVYMAILVHAGRADLVGYALTASVLMTLGQMSFFVASEVVANERDGQTLELLVASPAPYYAVLVTRIAVLTSLGLLGFAISWLIARLVFGVDVPIYHPGILIITLLATTFAAAGTALITAALFCFGRSTRTFQNAVGGPLYLLGGVLVPVTYLPDWVQPISTAVFFSWSADLLRDAMQPSPLENVPLRLAAILALGALAAGIGTAVLDRMLNKLRRDGTIGLL